MILGVDAGGTSTRAVIADRTGRCLGYGVAGGGNPVSRGAAQAGRAIYDAATRALAAAAVGGRTAGARADVTADVPAGVTADVPAEIDGVAVLAMAGASAFVSPGLMAAELRALGRISRVEVVSDLLGTFCSGTSAEDGYALVSGTGAAALRVQGGRITASADGLGWLLGDVGSGFWIGRRAVRSAVAALSGHGPWTAMATMLQQELGVEPSAERDFRGRLLSLESVVDQLYQFPPVELSRFAALAFRAAGVAGAGPSVGLSAGPAGLSAGPAGPSAGSSAGPAGPSAGGEPHRRADPVAVKILTEAKARLLDTIGAVRVAELPGPVVLGGSIAHRLPGLADAVRASFATVGMAPPEVTAVPDGAVGAAVLALRESGVDVTRDMFRRLEESVAAHRKALATA